MGTPKNIIKSDQSDGKKLEQGGEEVNTTERKYEREADNKDGEQKTNEIGSNCLNESVVEKEKLGEKACKKHKSELYSNMKSCDLTEAEQSSRSSEHFLSNKEQAQQDIQTNDLIITTEGQK